MDGRGGVCLLLRLPLSELRSERHRERRAALLTRGTLRRNLRPQLVPAKTGVGGGGGRVRGTVQDAAGGPRVGKKIWIKSVRVIFCVSGDFFEFHF